MMMKMGERKLFEKIIMSRFDHRLVKLRWWLQWTAVVPMFVFEMSAQKNKTKKKQKTKKIILDMFVDECLVCLRHELPVTKIQWWGILPVKRKKEDGNRNNETETTGKRYSKSWLSLWPVPAHCEWVLSVFPCFRVSIIFFGSTVVLLFCVEGHDDEKVKKRRELSNEIQCSQDTFVGS